jgi:hypothetical protein
MSFFRPDAERKAQNIFFAESVAGSLGDQIGLKAADNNVHRS